MNISATDFKLRRDTLAAQMQPNSIAVIATSAVAIRNRDADYKFRPDSSFYYLTGFAEPEAVAVIETFAAGEPYRFELFCRERNREMEIWNGYRAGLAGAVADYAADAAYAIAEFEASLVKKLQQKQTLYYRIGHDAQFDALIHRCMQQADSGQRRGDNAPASIQQLDRIVDEQRLIKSDNELAHMQRAADISAAAHTRAMQCVKAGMMEYALEAELNYIFGQNGCVPAYNSIVGGGENACILHYVENNQALQDGDLVLIDAACEYQYYAADITRTFPVNGVFTAEQKALYNVVLAAQLAAIDLVRVGQSYKASHFAAVKVLCEGLIELGLLSCSVEEAIEQERYRAFFMHGTGHWLGMDVHDVGRYKTHDQSNDDWRCYEVGMVVTVEPGLYIAPDDMTVEARWRGIGIRIEDDVVVTENGPRVLTAAVVKTVEDIEQLMAQARLNPV